ncbi:threonine synthase [Rickettsiales bacterium]|nr:threonine synthase [Rickettsiales bacterium]
MQYISTRGQAPALDFEDVVIAGLASDGGLYVPEEIPTFSEFEISQMAGLSYQDLMLRIVQPFIGDSISSKDLKNIIDESYSKFDNSMIAPLKQSENQEFILELFHGPTLAFKDFALQFLGHIFHHILKKRNQRVTVIGATSGDTGSAAIEGCRHSDHIDMFIMHPHKRISEVQRLQMTTILEDNVFNLAIEGDFDFCQTSMKEMFKDPEFVGGKTKLVAVNSINWCRIMAQIVYYFYAALHLGAPKRKIAFSVPTGNFGDIYAGYIAKRMGLPISQLVIATNKNDILHRFLSKNDYSRGKLSLTLSPSMDIQVSSNFERLLFDIHDRDSTKVAKLMQNLNAGGAINVESDILEQLRQTFSSASVDDDTACKTIKAVYEESGMTIDPHTAVGVHAARICRKDKNIPMVILSTAHPAKFPDAVKKAGVKEAPLPDHLNDLNKRKERFTVLKADIEKIKDFIADNLK